MSDRLNRAALLRRLWRRARRVMRYGRVHRTVHVTVPAGEQAVAFTADQDGLLAGDRIVIHWDRATTATSNDLCPQCGKNHAYCDPTDPCPDPEDDDDFWV